MAGTHDYRDGAGNRIPPSGVLEIYKRAQVVVNVEDIHAADEMWGLTR